MVTVFTTIDLLCYVHTNARPVDIHTYIHIYPRREYDTIYTLVTAGHMIHYQYVIRMRDRCNVM